MEDCILPDGTKKFKPDPFPCELACNLLSIPRSEFPLTAIIGDTPDDIASGVSAGILGFGVHVSSTGDEALASAMLAKGATTIFPVGFANLSEHF
jgi:phosphoglycolate phosphatase-like HAD superfamily hydrolase|tara:strand:- start:331 stop:615 length:285 start_codon:yes stop_codon:yes gene_type:complete